MLILLLMLIMSATVVALLALTVDHDGYGSRPAPRSHVRDSFDPHRPVC